MIFTEDHGYWSMTSSLFSKKTGSTHVIFEKKAIKFTNYCEPIRIS